MHERKRSPLEGPPRARGRHGAGPGQNPLTPAESDEPVYRDGSASVDPLHALVVDHSDEVWSVGGPDYLPPEGFGSDVVALDVEPCRRWRSRWRSCGSITAHVNTWPRWSTGGPLPRLHVARRPLTNRTTTAGSGRCAESEAAAIVTNVTVGQYVKLQVWTNRDHDPSLAEFG